VAATGWADEWVSMAVVAVGGGGGGGGGGGDGGSGNSCAWGLPWLPSGRAGDGGTRVDAVVGDLWISSCSGSRESGDRLKM
jgi:hypothetical protein